MHCKAFSCLTSSFDDPFLETTYFGRYEKNVRLFDHKTIIKLLPGLCCTLVVNPVKTTFSFNERLITDYRVIRSIFKNAYQMNFRKLLPKYRF